jgi:hypothetical protein
VLRSSDDEFDPASQLGGMVDPYDPTTNVERALRADARLADADVRRVMLMYHTLRSPNVGVVKPEVARRSAS